jgi:hypothetical protein
MYGIENEQAVTAKIVPMIQTAARNTARTVGDSFRFNSPPGNVLTSVSSCTRLHVAQPFVARSRTRS